MISVAVLTKNSEKYIRQCLNSLSGFSDVVLLDTGSTDATKEIAAEYKNVRVFDSEFIGFGALKDLNASHCKYDWVLTVDSDEVLSKELASEILSLSLDSRTVYRVKRHNYYNGKHIKGCGWHPQSVVRLYNKKETGYTAALVHEAIKTEGLKVELLEHPLLHFPMEKVSDFVGKMQFYSDLFMESNRFKRKMSAPMALIKAFVAFFRQYILRKGILFGFEGFVISISDANGVLYKCLKLAEANRKLDVSLIVTTYNRPDALELVLKSVFKQTKLPREILVADDGSGAETKEMINSLKEGAPVLIKHLWQEDKGFRVAACRNSAIREAQGEYIILIDGDICLHPSFIEDHIKAARKGYFVQGSRCFLSQRVTGQLLGKSTPFKASVFMGGLENRLKAVHSRLLSRIFSTRSSSLKGIRTSNMAVWKEDIEAVNGFNEDFEGWGREDSEFVARLYHKGLKRLNLKCSGQGFHLYHKEASRDHLKKNEKLLAETLEQKKVCCKNGLCQEDKDEC
jgi:glycosyltransferase involved in cell wall biosynthesis